MIFKNIFVKKCFSQINKAIYNDQFIVGPENGFLPKNEPLS
jgi:hypothetical protein